MSFQDELSNIPNNLKSFVEGDIEIGNAHIPKIVPVGLVVGLVAFLGYRASKNRPSSSPVSSSQADGSSIGQSPDAAADGYLDVVNGGSPKDYNDIGYQDTNIGLPIDSGTGYQDTLDSNFTLPVTSDYNLPDYVNGYGGYTGYQESNIPLMTSYGSDGNQYQLPQQVRSGLSSNQINSIKRGNVGGSGNGGIVSRVQSGVGKAVSNVTGIGNNNTKPKGSTGITGKAGSQVNNTVKANKPTSTVNGIGNRLIAGASQGVNNVFGGLGVFGGSSSGASNASVKSTVNNKPVGVISVGSTAGKNKVVVKPTPVANNVKPPQINTVVPKVTTSKVVVSSTTKKPVTIGQNKVVGGRVVLR